MESPPPAEDLTVLQEFRGFLDKYNVIALAVAFVIGAALTALVQAFVNDILTPLLITPLLPEGAAWRDATWSFGPWTEIAWGHFVAQLLNFLIIAVVVFFMVKFVLRENPTTKR